MYVLSQTGLTLNHEFLHLIDFSTNLNLNVFHVYCSNFEEIVYWTIRCWNSVSVSVWSLLLTCVYVFYVRFLVTLAELLTMKSYI